MSSVDTIVDPQVEQFELRVRYKEPKGLLSETSFRGEVELDLKDRLAIPESAVLHTGKKIVYVVGETIASHRGRNWA